MRERAFLSFFRSLSLSLCLSLFLNLSSLTRGAHEGEVERVEEEHDVLALLSLVFGFFFAEVKVEVEVERSVRQRPSI